MEYVEGPASLTTVVNNINFGHASYKVLNQYFRIRSLHNKFTYMLSEPIPYRKTQDLDDSHCFVNISNLDISLEKDKHHRNVMHL
jgi:hypothetical protein